MIHERLSSAEFQKALLGLSILSSGLSLFGADGPLPPEAALKSFELEPGLRIQLVAAEPLVVSPCALAWDERGRLFVAENRGYPLGGPDGKPAGVISMLEDTDGDGQMDRRTEFATGLTFPNGVMPWRGGLIVTCAPDVFYLKDTDGDGIADVKEVLLTGFATNQSTQLRVNAPMLASDGWVYLASGLSGGKISSPKRPLQSALDLKGDLRFNPDTGEYQHIDGKSQFGQSFDDFGRRFGVFNRVQVQHFVLPSHYIARNPRLSFGQVLQNCPELEPNPFLPGNNGAARLYPISANITTADSHAGTFTAACAIHIYRADGLPGEYYGHAFSCDPTGNLVHHDRLNPIGATFAAERVREKSEFLRSRDDWFRPVFLATGPDGALYVADIYRKVIEHPEYLPVEIRKRTNFEGGKGMGRIWRVMSDTPARSIRATQLVKASNAELVPELASPNSWRRDTAFRLLSERRSEPVIPLLKKTVGPRLSPAGASATLYLLALLNALDEPTLSAALTSPYAGVRETALKLSESNFEKSPQLRALALKLADDADPRVRFQCALSIGPAASKPAVAALVKIAARDEPDRWTRAAILSSVPERDEQQMPLLRGLLETKSRESESLNALVGDLSRMIGAGLSERELGTTLNLLLSQSAGAGFGAQSAIINGFAESARGMKLSGSGPVLLRLAPNEMTQLFRTATNIALGADQPVSRRLSAARVLANASYEIAAQPLRSLLGSAAPAELQIAAIRALTAIEEGGASQALLEPALWKSYSPALREAVLSSLLSRPRHLPAVLTALESGALPLNAIESGRREQLKKSKDDSIRTRAEKLFASMANGDRMKAYEEAKTALSLKPSGANGKEVFKRACANCHRLDGDGFAVGPDLFDIRNHSKESILLHIIIPEYEIAPNFANYICETKDGRTLSGILIGDVPAGITLRQTLGAEEKISRSDIASLNASPLSLMPQELEKGMTKREIADLLAYLRGEN